MQIDTQRKERGREELDEACIADKRGKLAAEMQANLVGIECFEGAVMRLVKQNQNRHNLTQGKLAAAIALFVATHQAVLVLFRLKGLAKVIDSAKEFQYTHGGAPFSTTFWFQHP
jgi:hypothetical protein